MSISNKSLLFLFYSLTDITKHSEKMVKSILPTLEEIHKNIMWADVFIKSRSRIHLCHKFVLSIAFPRLNMLFTDKLLDGEDIMIVMDDFSAEDVETLISYAYHDIDQLPDILQGAFDRFVLPFKEGIRESESDIKCEVLEPLHTDDLDALTDFLKEESEFIDEDSWGKPSKLIQVGIKRKRKLKKTGDEYAEKGKKKRSYKPREFDRIYADCDLDKVTSEDGKIRHKCQYCGYFKSKLRVHVKQIHPEMWEDYCESVRIRVKERKTRGGNEYPKECQFCPVLSKDKYSFERHLMTHRDVMGPMDYVCDKCGQSFPSESYLRNHELQHTQYIPCDVENCDQTFPTKYAYKDHLLFYHKIVDRYVEKKKSEVVKKEAIHICHHCSQAFTSTTGLKLHLKHHEKSDVPHLCPKCGEKFETAEALRTHKIIHRYDSDMNDMVVCNECGIEVKKCSMSKHIQNMHQPLTVPCPFCDKMFRNKYKMKDHIKRNHVDDSMKSFKCNICPKAFTNAASLETHVNAHNGLKPYSCPHCPNMHYQNKSNLRAHMRKRHDLQKGMPISA